MRSRDPAALKQAIAQAVAGSTAAELETRLSARGIPAARLRNIAEFAAESMANGSLRAVTLQEGEAGVLSPGLGFQVYRSSAGARGGV
ncbi:hypothetical protein D3C81_1570560 [compost metagenome]